LLYQDDVTAPLDRAFDDNAAGQGDDDEEDGDGEEVDTSQVLERGSVGNQEGLPMHYLV